MASLLSFVFSRAVARGNLEVLTARGVKLVFGDITGPLVAIRFADSASERAFITDPDMKLGELFMDGKLTMESGSIYDFIHLMLKDTRGQKAPLFLRSLDRFRFATRKLRQRNFASKSKSNVAHHYDLDSRLYKLFLDDDMQYSCAYFETPEHSLGEAQLAKKRHIAAKLCVEPGMNVLDIGCGWGGMAMYLARFARAGSVLGVTLSEEQIAIARQRIATGGLDDKVRFALQDYRSVTGTFDRIVSVGMFEHVGVAFYDTFFKTCHRLLDRNGVMLLHTIGCSDVPGFVTPWLDKYIFPGGYIPSLSEIIPVIERAGLIVSDVEILQLHYAETLKAWRARFMARRAEAVALYDERFCRMWEFYLAAAEAAFRCEDLNIFQLQITREPAKSPTTRNYITTREQALKAEEDKV